MLDQITAITQVGARYWQPFAVTSPGGIPFAGYICRHESEKLGMLAITELAGQERLEFVYAMPKIHYPYEYDRDGRPMVAISVPQNTADARFTLKLDGTAIIFYPLKDAAGAVLEVLPRTRLQPVLAASRWGDWWKLLDEAMPDRARVQEAVSVQDAVLIFELWGYRNPHLVSYGTPLALTLHTAVRHRKVASFRRLSDIAARYGFDLIPTLEVAAPNAAGLAEAYRRWQDRMEAANQAAGSEVYTQEGAILVLSTAETATYWKCKPPSIEEIHWAGSGEISKESIVQALHKMLENGYDFAPGHVEDLHAMLEADFDPRQIEGAVDLIQREFLDFSVEMQRRAWLRQMVEDSGLDVRDLPNLMRYLSQHYPKREMSWVYASVKAIYGLG